MVVVDSVVVALGDAVETPEISVGFRVMVLVSSPPVLVKTGDDVEGAEGCFT